MDSENAENEISMEEKKDTSNVERVLFAKPVVKKIVSYHSGSILATPDPFPPIDSKLKLKALELFKSVSTDKPTINKSFIVELLQKCGFNADSELLSETVDIHYDGLDEMTEEDFICFVEKFHAPEYYYGQRMRRYAGRGQVLEVTHLLARNCDVNTGDGEGLTSLHYASEFNQTEVIKTIFKSVSLDKIIVDCQDKYGWTPLYCAAHHGNLDVVNLLLNFGAKPTIRNAQGKTVLHAACAQNRVAIVDAILKTVRPASPSSKKSSRAAAASEASNNNSNINLTTESGLLNAQDDSGMTPLHEATYRGHINLYQILCRNPAADISIVDVLNNTAADYLSDFSAPAEKKVPLPVPPPSASITSKDTKRKGTPKVK